jgi:hypothetical protein
MGSFLRRERPGALALALLVPLVLADDPDHTFAPDDLAVGAHLSD